MVDNVLKAAIDLTRRDGNALPTFVKLTKMQEESGELAEAVLQMHGYVAKDKAGVGSVMEESADMFLQVIDTLQDAYPHLDTDELMYMFDGMLQAKLTKWVEKKMSLLEDMYYNVRIVRGLNND